MSSIVLQQKWVNFQSKALKSLGGGRLSHLSASCQVTKFVAVYTHIWATPNSSYLCSTVLKTNTILGSNFLYLLSVAPCSPMYKIGGEIWFLLQDIACQTVFLASGNVQMQQTRGAEEGKGREGAHRDIRTILPGAAKGSQAAWSLL